MAFPMTFVLRCILSNFLFLKHFPFAFTIWLTFDLKEQHFFFELRKCPSKFSWMHSIDFRDFHNQFNNKWKRRRIHAFRSHCIRNANHESFWIWSIFFLLLHKPYPPIAISFTNIIRMEPLVPSHFMQRNSAKDQKKIKSNHQISAWNTV